MRLNLAMKQMERLNRGLSKRLWASLIVGCPHLLQDISTNFGNIFVDAYVDWLEELS